MNEEKKIIQPRKGLFVLNGTEPEPLQMDEFESDQDSDSDETESEETVEHGQTDKSVGEI